MSHKAFHNGMKLLLQMQKSLKYVPKRKLIKDYVHTLVKEGGLREDPRRRYFELLATTTLMGLESMHTTLRRKHGHKKESKRKSS
jgi:hypothetical protein